MKKVKAIQTFYKGYHFRSRLEARWAVFFDTLGIKWEYEKEGYNLPYTGNYLPDFWLPQYEQWVEIKGCLPTNHWTTTTEEEKVWELARETQYDAYIFFGMPDFETPFTEYRDGESYRCESVVNWCPDASRLCNQEHLGTAIEAAKSARFEFGESGATR